MKLFKRQFGAKFTEALSQCPTLVKDLEQMRQAGVKIRRIKGHCQAYAELKRMTVYISKNCSLSYALVSLAHEKTHLLVSPTPPPLPGITNRHSFINRGMKSELNAICHEVQVVAELLNAGYKVNKHSLKWHRLFKKGGRAAVKAELENAVTSNTGEKYRQYYGAWFDDVSDDEASS
ncbi:hypothetical protein BH10CYA1_BH10CYA1_32340 [soil metagenome]